MAPLPPIPPRNKGQEKMKVLILAMAFELLSGIASARSTHLLDATLAGKAAGVRKLIQAGEPVSQARAGNVEILNLLVAEGADLRVINNSGVTLAHAAITGDLPAVEWAIKVGLGLNLHEKDYGATPLHWAAFNKKDDVGLALIKAGADVNAKTNDGATPLDFAERKQAVEVEAFLSSVGN